MYDVVVVGGGNAALCAAISAAENNTKVLIVEVSTKELRGGNSQHTRNMRIAHEEPTKVLNDVYSVEEYWNDLHRVTKGETNEKLARIVIEESQYLCQWLEDRGMLFQNSISGTLSLSRTNAFFYGGGKTLVNNQYRKARALGVEIVYEHEVLDIHIENNEFHSLKAKTPEGMKTFKGKSLIAASGGFESNIDWLEEIWGEKARNFLIRGTRFNQGKVLKKLLEQGIQEIGQANQCHAVAIDGRAPLYDGGIVTRLDCVPFGVVLNKNAERFYDEGEDFWPKRYAIWGRLVAGQPDQVAYVIIDSKSIDLFMPSVFKPEMANTLKGLAKKLNLEPKKMQETIRYFNNHVIEGKFDPANLDDCHTEGLEPNKTHWARRVDEPPFYGYPLRPGITFTYLGVKVDEDARMIMKDGSKTKGLFAAGEIMAGNILSQGYLAGFGMTMGSVFGIRAGKGAVKDARN